MNPVCVATFIAAAALLAGCDGSFAFDVPDAADATVADSSAGGDAAPEDARTDAPDAMAPLDGAADAGDGGDANDASYDAPAYDGGADADAAADASYDAGTDADEALTDPGTNCGEAGSCAPASQFCCSSNGTFSCLTSGQDVCTGVRLECDDSAGCPPSAPYCCGEKSGQSVSSAQCKPGCGSDDYLFCDPYNTKCPAGLACKDVDAGGLPAGYMTCQ